MKKQSLNLKSENEDLKEQLSGIKKVNIKLYEMLNEINGDNENNNSDVEIIKKELQQMQTKNLELKSKF